MMIFVRKNHKSSVSQPLVGVKMRAWAFLNVEFHDKYISDVFKTTGNRLGFTISQNQYFLEIFEKIKILKSSKCSGMTPEPYKPGTLSKSM